MNYKAEYIFCSEKLISPLAEVQEVFSVVESVRWKPEGVEVVSLSGRKLAGQQAYNRLFAIGFENMGGWTLEPVLCEKPRFKGDFIKNHVFVEIQFGNSATIFRDYYKFHLGLVRKLLSLAVLIIPTNQYEFFPQRNPRSIGNMATFEYALEHFEALTIPVPILLIGLIPSN